MADRNCTVVSIAIEDRRVIAETVGRVIVAADELGKTERFERYNTFSDSRSRSIVLYYRFMSAQDEGPFRLPPQRPETGKEHKYGNG